MADITTISTVLGSIKTATDIAKLIKDSGSSLEQAEVKLKIAELVSALADAKIELAEVQGELQSKDQIIASLRDDLAKKEGVKFDGEYYFAVNDDVPYCPVCYEKDNKLIHLTFYERGFYDDEAFYECRVCTHKYYNTSHE